MGREQPRPIKAEGQAISRLVSPELREDRAPDRVNEHYAALILSGGREDGAARVQSQTIAAETNGGFRLR